MELNRFELVEKHRKLKARYDNLITTTHILEEEIYINNQKQICHNISLMASEIKKEMLRIEVEIMMLDMQSQKDLSEKSEDYMQTLSHLLELI